MGPQANHTSGAAQVGPAPDNPNVPKAPGSSASTVQAEHLWDPLARWIMHSRSSWRLRVFCRSSFLKQGYEAKEPRTPRPVWPIPLPYASPLDGEQKEKSFKHAINVMVVILNWLQLGQPRSLPKDFSTRAPLSPEQLSIVKRLRRLAAEWMDLGEVTAEEMGRAAGKVESLEATVRHLTVRAVRMVEKGGSARMAGPRCSRSGETDTLLAEVQLAKDIESNRLAFRGEPAFDPLPYLEGEVRAIYEEPLANSLDPAEALATPPHVQVRGKQKEVMGLLKKLDATNRLALLDPKTVRKGREAGLFSLMKNTTTDRLILDARPANELEVGINDWTASMATIVPLLDLVIPPQSSALAAGEDLRDYYYYFLVSPSRCTRNAIKYKVPLAEARRMKSYPSAVPELREYVPGLATMAMGDINAVEVGQQSHVMLAMSIGIRAKDLLTLRGRLPREGPYIGIVIDDFVVLELVPRSLSDPKELESSRIADRMLETYAAVGLKSNETKRFRAATSAKFWGASFQGDAGTMRAQLEKVLPIALVTAQVARLGAANRKLLEILTGSWVAILQYRRRAMCLLDSLFADIQRFDYSTTFFLAAETVDELWTLVGLCPLFVADLRAAVNQELALVDASGEWEAEVTTTVTPELATELSRQKLTKAAWSRLLTPFQARQRMHGLLSPSQEIPEGEEPARNHPLWTTAVKSHQFSLRWRKRTKRGAHINVSELSAALRSEARRCRRYPNQRLLLGSDSQVTLGALVRGRSSSKSLNRQLKQALPNLLAYNIYTNTQYIPTAVNTADDPTRDKECRPAELPEPFWFSEAAAGRFAGLDSILEAQGIDDESVARLPTRPRWREDVAGAVSEQEELVSAEAERPCGALCPSGDLRVPSVPSTSTEPAASSLFQCRDLPSLAPMRQQLRTGRNHRSRKPPVAAAPVFEPWLPRRRLDCKATKLLSALPRNQFVVPRGLKYEDIADRPGHLDLFSGCRVAAQELANRSGRWVLTYDIEHSPLEDLLNLTVQAYIETMLEHGCFLTVTGGPVCASFSRAVRPAVRTALKPEGLDDLTETMQRKVEMGNRMSQWVARIVVLCLTINIPFWIENPAGSFLWLQPEWRDIVLRVQSFVTDYCRWSTPWRKRTRFLGAFSAAGKRCMCVCKQKHVQLTGYSSSHKCSWTKAAEAYPRPLAAFLAGALVESLKPPIRRRELDPAACARCNSRRIGEATNPGPRPRHVRPSVDLEQVQLVQPSTIAIQNRAHRLFLDWLQQELTAESWESIKVAPQLQIIFLRSFGNWMYNQGMPMYLFRHLVVLCQQQYPAERHQITTAWELLARWELVQPVTHRPPLPKPLLDAFVCLALSWGWARWAAVTMLAFHGACRVGEPLRACRRDLILPEEAGLESEIVFLNIAAPKPGRRGKGKTQHTKITDLSAVRLAVAVFSHLQPEEQLYPSTLSSFRRRWDRLCCVLEIPKTASITPGCVRGGGAVFLYHKGEPIANIQWTMRLKHQGTLESYLQETAALAVMQRLHSKSKQMVQSCSRMLPFIMRIWTSSNSSLGD